MARLFRLASFAFPIALGVAAASLTLGCGGGNQGLHAASAQLTADQIDADPLRLLPGSATVVATIDARAFYSSGSLGAELATLSEQIAPIGDEAGFKPSRDVDRVALGTYSGAGVDVVAVLSGRFDEAKIKQAADNHVTTRAGGALTVSQYAGRNLYAVGDMGFCVLTPHTALAGTQGGIRRALDRVKDGAQKREISDFAQQTIDTPNAAATVIADFTQPIDTAALGTIQIPWAKGIKGVRAVADFKPPGMHVAGTLTYADGTSAGAGANGIRQAGTLANLVAMTGLTPRLQDLNVNLADTNVQCSFSVDDQALRGILAALPRFTR
jgi:hypothetical protein